MGAPLAPFAFARVPAAATRSAWPEPAPRRPPAARASGAFARASAPRAGLASARPGGERAAEPPRSGAARGAPLTSFPFVRVPAATRAVGAEPAPWRRPAARASVAAARAFASRPGITSTRPAGERAAEPSRRGTPLAPFAFARVSARGDATRGRAATLGPPGASVAGVARARRRAERRGAVAVTVAPCFSQPSRRSSTRSGRRIRPLTIVHPSSFSYGDAWFGAARVTRVDSSAGVAGTRDTTGDDGVSNASTAKGEAGGASSSSSSSSSLTTAIDWRIGYTVALRVHWFPYDRVGVVNADP